MQSIKFLHQTLAFLLELCMLAAMGRWAYLQGKTPWAKYSFAFLIIALTVVLWAYFAAPKSPNRLMLEYRIIFEFLLFGIACWMLYSTSLHKYAWIFGITVLVSLCLEFYFEKK